MLLGRINNSIKELLKKERFTKVDVKLLNGIFDKTSKTYKKKKTIYDTFVPNVTSTLTNSGSKIVRRFKDFIVKHTLEDDDEILS
jgi:hypothetical protein